MQHRLRLDGWQHESTLPIASGDNGSALAVDDEERETRVIIRPIAYRVCQCLHIVHRVTRDPKLAIEDERPDDGCKDESCDARTARQARRGAIRCCNRRGTRNT